MHKLSLYAAEPRRWPELGSLRWAELRKNGQKDEHPQRRSSQTLKTEHGDDGMKNGDGIVLKTGCFADEPMKAELRYLRHISMNARSLGRPELLLFHPRKTVIMVMVARAEQELPWVLSSHHALT
ncbi:hypothetical protein Dimus_036124 [Dionaea muscipula]